MKPFKELLAEQLLYHKYHFKCDCLFPIDFIGVVKSYKIENNEIIFMVEHKGKLIPISENHPNLQIGVE